MKTKNYLQIVFSIMLLITTVVFFACDKEEEKVEEKVNQLPKIESVNASPETLPISGIASLSCSAIDADGDDLQYIWSCNKGSFPEGSNSNTVKYKAPDLQGTVSIEVSVSDGKTNVKSNVNITIYEIDVPICSIDGNVYMINTTTPIAGTIVTIGNITATTDGNGYYALNNVETGEQTIEASKTGFSGYSQQITCEEGDNNKNIYLRCNVE